MTVVLFIFSGTKYGHSPSHHPKMFAILCADLNDLHDAIKGIICFICFSSKQNKIIRGFGNVVLSVHSRSR